MSLSKIKKISLFYEVPKDVLLHILKYLNNIEIMMFEWSVNMTEFRNISYIELFKSELETKLMEKYDNRSFDIIDEYYISQDQFYRNKCPKYWKYEEYDDYYFDVYRDDNIDDDIYNTDNDIYNKCDEEYTDNDI